MSTGAVVKAGSYWCQRFGAADVLILPLGVERFQHSMLQWVLTSAVDYQPWLDPVYWKKTKTKKTRSSRFRLEIWWKQNWSLPVSSHPHLIGPFDRDVRKVQKGFIIRDAAAKAFRSIWLKHFEQVLWTFNSLFLLLVIWEIGYPSCHDIVHIKSSRTILSAVSIETSHRSHVSRI